MGQDLPPLEESSLDFTCVRQFELNPPLDPEADAWYKKARRIEKGQEAGSPEEVVALYQKAIEKKHWKAIVNLALIYTYGDGVEQNLDKAIDLLELGMQMNIGRAYSNMGDLLAQGLGVKKDTKAALAYQRRAADLGDPAAQELIGNEFLSQISGVYRPELGKKFLECAISQGFGPAAFSMGQIYYLTETSEFDSQKALHYFQLGVKLGDEDCARTLISAFREYAEGEPRVIDLKLKADPERARRYREIYRKIGETPGIKFPDIDRMVPLPPKPLPAWKGPVGVVE